MKKYSFSYEETEDGIVVDGELYDDIESVLLSGFGFCGCGNPEDALNYIYLILCDIRDKEKLTEDRYKMTWRNDREKTFFLYWANKEGLVQHGGSVGGSWISEKGLTFIKDVETYKSKESYCTCECHNTNSVTMHFTPCCDGNRKPFN